MKKNFCDGWDNVGQLLLVNLIFLVYLVATFVILTFLAPLNSFLGMAIFVVCNGCGSILLMAFGENAVKIANFNGVSIKDYFVEIKFCSKDGFLLGVLCSILFCAVTIGIPAYLSMKSILGFMLAVFLFWIGVISLLALQWFIPLRSLMHNDFKKCLKKCFIILFDNLFFSIFVLLYNAFLILLSAFLLFLLPSGAGIVLSQINALRLRLYKYDYLEAHPELTTRSEQSDIPWDELIAEDKEILGPRTFRSFIFPWKD